MTKKVYVICQGDRCYFKGYTPSTKEVSWTGILNRAAMWFAEDVAEDQAWELNATEGGARWSVKGVEI